MFQYYSELIDWLNKFPTGVQVANQLNFVIPVEKELGFVIKDADFYESPLEATFYLFDKQYFIVGDFEFDQKNMENNFFNIEVYKISDIEAKKIHFSNQSGIQPVFKNLQLYLPFKGNIESILLDSTDFTRSSKEFREFVGSISKL